MKFLEKEYDFRAFQVLSGKQLSNLSLELKAKYDEYLAKFVTDFRQKHPEGFEIELPVINFGNPYQGKNSKGKPVMKAAITIDTDETIEAVSDLLNLQTSQLDIIAKNAGFPNYTVMKFMTASHLDKGSLRMTVSLREAGETVEGRGGIQVNITKTHVRQDDLVVIPSATMQVAQAKAVERAAIDSFKDLFNVGGSGAGETVSVESQEETEEPNL